jgi:hypothetical protein
MSGVVDSSEDLFVHLILKFTFLARGHNRGTTLLRKCIS